MAREWIKYPTVNLTTELGPVRAAFTDEGHVAVSVEAHHNDDAPALVYRGREYIGMVHLYAEPGDGKPAWSWKFDRKDYAPEGSWSKRGTFGDAGAAPRTHRAALTAACEAAVRAYVEADPDILLRAMYSHANNVMRSLEAERETLMNQVQAIDVQLMEAKRRLLRGTPPETAEAS